MTRHDDDAESSVTTIHETGNIHRRHSLSAVTHLHNDPTATAVMVQGTVEAMDIEEDINSVGPTRKTAKGFWKSRLALRDRFEGDPRHELSRFRKTVILCVVSQAGCLAGFSSTIYVCSRDYLAFCIKCEGTQWTLFLNNLFSFNLSLCLLAYLDVSIRSNSSPH